MYLGLLHEGFSQWLLNNSVCERTLLQWEHILRVSFLDQEEDSEEEPKLKYERLSNGVTEILQKDAASCMTVHDKVEVTIHHPQEAFRPQVPPSRVRISHCLCTHLRDVLFKSWFLSPCVHSTKAAHSFLTFPLLFLSGRHIKRHQAPLSSSFYSHSYTFFAALLCLSNVDVF